MAEDWKDAVQRASERAMRAIRAANMRHEEVIALIERADALESENRFLKAELAEASAEAVQLFEEKCDAEAQSADTAIRSYTMRERVDAELERVAGELERAADVWAWIEREGVSLMPVLGGSGAFVGWSCGHIHLNKRVVRATPWEAVQAARAALPAPAAGATTTTTEDAR